MPHDLEGLERHLNEIVGGEHLLSGAAAAGFAVDGVVPTLVARPGTQEQVEAAVAACGTAGAAIAPWGGGTAMGLGNAPARLDAVVCLDRLSRIVEFDAANLVVSAEAGVRMADLQQLLATKREVLPLDCARMDRRTVGGIIANLPGVRSIDVEGDLLRASVAGPVDALVKTAARYTVESISGHEADLEDVFLAYYVEADDAAA
jgi:glycolate oxidase FAD binding subunit